MTSREIKLIKRDFEKLLQSPEACNATLRFYVDLGGGELGEVPQELPDVRCVQQVVGPRDLRLLKDRIIEVGDAIFYFSSTQNLNEPIAGQPIAQGTLKIVDPSGLVWSPKLIDQGEAARFLTFHVMDMQIGQVVVCALEK
ncbi:MAG: hypothetical protein DA330_09595 [Nitrososphaera sp.]|nr:hypothetical protein [Nitrososphaera sp.]